MKIMTTEKFEKECIEAFDRGVKAGDDVMRLIITEAFIKAETPEEFCDWAYRNFVKDKDDENTRFV